MGPQLFLDDVWQITCGVSAKSVFAEELLYETLVSSGIERQDIVEQTKGNRREIVLFHRTLKSAKGLFAKIQSLNLRGVRVSLKYLKKSDWQERWKKGIKPFALTATIDVVPRWSAAKYKKRNKFPVFIDTNLAFGTGLHETTRFMAQLIENSRGKFSSFLDVGTGSGILVVIAKFCGAKKLTAIDIDRQSIAVAKTNLAANHVKNVRLLCADVERWKHAKRYDFVAANLVTDDLVNFGNKLVGLVLPQKYLAVSGISLKNLARLQKSFRALPLKKIKVLRGKEWAAVLYQRKADLESPFKANCAIEAPNN